MNKKLELDLVKKYPNLYKQYGGDITKTCMGWGFECDDGWFKLIDGLSAKLQPYGIEAGQVKEKLGGLRFYLIVHIFRMFYMTTLLPNLYAHEFHRICRMGQRQYKTSIHQTLL